jgi:uncharacterized protein YwgA
VSRYAEVMAYLRNLGLEEGRESFSDRIRIQKVVYMLKQFGADLKFGYTWYKHGPYSPSLTHTLYNPDDQDLRSRRELTAAELRVVNETRNFLGSDFYSADSMELIASLIYLIKHGPNSGLDSRSKIVSVLRQQKPQYSTEQVDAAWDKIAKAKKWNVFLSKLSRG